MTLSAGMLFAVSMIDFLLLLGSFMAYRGTLRLQTQYERMCEGWERTPTRVVPGRP